MRPALVLAQGDRRPPSAMWIPEMADFVGRDEALEALTAAIEKGRGAVVSGPAGIGKTRLATEAANASQRHVWWMPVTVDSGSIPGRFRMDLSAIWYLNWRTWSAPTSRPQRSP